MELDVLSWRVRVERIPFSTSALERRYDEHAGGWSRTVKRLGFAKVYKKLVKEPLTHAAFEGSTLLDCGVGSGALLRAVADAHPGLELHGVDLSAKMLEQCRRQVEPHPVTLQQADVRKLPYPDASFDTVVSAHLLEHFGDPSEVLTEMARVLRPGGWLLLVVTRRGFLGHLVHLKWRIHCTTPDRLMTLLNSSGFAHVQEVPLQGPGWCRAMSCALLARKAA